MTFNLIPQAYAAGFTPGNLWGKGLNDCAVDGVATISGLECLIGNILQPLPALIALAAVAMIIMAGIKIMNAGTDTKAYAAGWSTFTYAVVGLILLSVVWFAIIIIQNYTGATDITNFGIPN